MFQELKSMNIYATKIELNSPSLAKGCPEGGVVALLKVGDTPPFGHPSARGEFKISDKISCTYPFETTSSGDLFSFTAN